MAIDFPDLPGQGTLAEIVASLEQTVGSYFDEVSRSRLELQFFPLAESWVRMANEYSFYGSDGSGVDNANQPIFELAREALIQADAQVDYRLLDVDGNERLDAGELHLLLVQSGDDQAETGQSTDIWSHRWWIYGPPHGYDETILDDVLVSEPNISGEETSPGYVMVAASDALGVIAHELLHSFGAPDLYSLTSWSHYPVGPWSLMDIGLWLGAPAGSSPCRPGGYLEWDVDADPRNGISGWVTPQTLYDGEHTLSALGTETGIEVAVVNTPVDGEFFLLENRQQSGVDADLHESGVLIYHVDTSEPVNNVESTPPFRLWLEDPGTRPGKRGAAYSEDDGPEQVSFTPETDPSSGTYDGQSSDIAITSIGPEAGLMSFVLQGAGQGPVPTRFLVGPNPSTTGFVTAYLPEPGSLGAVLELYDLSGRRLIKRELPPGAHSYSLSLPRLLSSGTFVVLYRSSAANYSAPIVYLATTSSGN
jgi:immune inhibitor A